MKADNMPHSATDVPPPTISTEENVYADVYRVLLGGMVISSVLFAVGVVRALLHPQVVLLTPEWVRQQYQWGTLSRGLIHLEPSSLMLVATALLILTPVARVVVSIYAFAVDHDRKYTVITAIVLVVMGLTIVLGMLGLR